MKTACFYISKMIFPHDTISHKPPSLAIVLRTQTVRPPRGRGGPANTSGMPPSVNEAGTWDRRVTEKHPKPDKLLRVPDTIQAGQDHAAVPLNPQTLWQRKFIMHVTCPPWGPVPRLLALEHDSIICSALCYLWKGREAMGTCGMDIQCACHSCSCFIAQSQSCGLT